MTTKHFSAFAGGLGARGARCCPRVTRTTEELLTLVPESLREAGARPRGAQVACHPAR